jgi:hypothetical protein
MYISVAKENKKEKSKKKFKEFDKKEIPSNFVPNWLGSFAVED